MVFWLSGIVGYLYGRNPLAPFTIYAAQTGEYKRMYMNMPSFWMVLGDDYGSLSGFAVVFTLFYVGQACMSSFRASKK